MARTPGVGFYGKVRIATIGHKKAIDQAKGLADKHGGKLTIGLSGTSEPLTPALKKKHAETVFQHPVMSGNEHTKTLSHFLTHMSSKHDELHLVAGSDRAGEYKKFLEKYNGKKDRNGKVPFHFKKWHVHEVSGERTESNKDPRKMSKDELERSVSASKVEKIAKDGKYDHFKAYHPGMPESHVRKLYTTIRAHHGLNEAAIGLTFARSEMPQLEPKAFVDFLKMNGIDSVRQKVNPDDLKSSQMEFDHDKIMSLRDKQSTKPIIVSNDGHVLDGHHRWLADHQEGRNCDAYVCNLPILDLMHKAKNYNRLDEEITHKELAPMLDSFVMFASDKLGIKSMPSVRYKTEDDGYNSFAAYNPSSNELSVHTKGRHPMDVFRSVAHELVHHKQNEEGRIGKNIAKEGSTGSKIENEANAEAGKIMRWFAKANPEYFAKSHIVEETLEEGINDPGKLKAVFLAGGPGSGKDFVMRSVLDGHGLKEINSDTAFEMLMSREGLDLEMPEHERLERDIVRGKAQNITKNRQRLAIAGRLGLIINGTAGNVEETTHVKKLLERLGYETMMVFVNTSDEVSRQRNVQRGKDGKRKVPDGTNKMGIPDGSPNIRKEKWDAAQKNIGAFQEIFGMDRFTVIDNTSDQRKLEPEDKEKVLASFNNVRRMVHNFVNTPNHNQNAHNWINREADKRGITQYEVPRGAKTLNQFRQTPTNITPEMPDNSLMAQARRMGLSYYGFGRFGRKMNGKNTTMYREKDGRLQRIIKEEVDMNQLFEDVVVEGKDTHKMLWGSDYLRKDYEKNTPGSTKKMKIKRKVVAKEDRAAIPQLQVNMDGVGPEMTMYRPLNVLGFTAGLTESIVAWVNNPKTQAKFLNKYGDLAEQKLEEAALKLEASGCGTPSVGKKKSIREFYEVAKSGLYSGRREEIEEDGAGEDVIKPAKTLKAYKKKIHPMSTTEKASLKEAKSPAWTRKEGQSQSGGLNDKGIASYRRANPGSKLSKAVTTKPSKLKKGSKAANRRKSFCARMGGMKKRLTSAKTANDPNSRINKALRKWNCE